MKAPQRCDDVRTVVVEAEEPVCVGDDVRVVMRRAGTSWVVQALVEGRVRYYAERTSEGDAMVEVMAIVAWTLPLSERVVVEMVP